MSNDIEKLRSVLFDTLTQLRDKENPMDIDRAKAVCQVSDVIIDSAKTEIEFAKVNGSVDSQFFKKPQLPAPAGQQIESQSEQIVISAETQQQPAKQNDTKTLQNGNKITVEGNVTRHISH
jgi:hypothetical protein